MLHAKQCLNRTVTFETFATSPNGKYFNFNVLPKRNILNIDEKFVHFRAFWQISYFILALKSSEKF